MLFSKGDSVHLSPLDKLFRFLEEASDAIEALSIEEVNEELENRALSADALARAIEDQTLHALGEAAAKRGKANDFNPGLWHRTWPFEI